MADIMSKSVCMIGNTCANTNLQPYTLINMFFTFSVFDKINWMSVHSSGFASCCSRPAAYSRVRVVLSHCRRHCHVFAPILCRPNARLHPKTGVQHPKTAHNPTARSWATHDSIARHVFSRPIGMCVVLGSNVPVYPALAHDRWRDLVTHQSRLWECTGMHTVGRAVATRDLCDIHRALAPPKNWPWTSRHSQLWSVYSPIRLWRL